jgi:type IV pilus assembly protein PilA
MRRARTLRSGFTLVELMIVVAIIGVLAALSIYSVRRYLLAAKTSEGRMMVGAITRGAVAAFERENVVSERLTDGVASAKYQHDVCEGTNAPVPDSVAKVKGRKYQPITANGDYQAGTSYQGWSCLKFTNSSPQSFMLGYQADPLSAGLTGVAPLGGVAPAGADTFVAWAAGDLNSNDVPSGIAMRGVITPSKALKLASQLELVNEFE